MNLQEMFEGAGVEGGKLCIPLETLGLEQKDTVSGDKILFAVCRKASETYKALKPAERTKAMSVSYSPNFDAGDGTVQHAFGLRFTAPMPRTLELVD